MDKVLLSRDDVKTLFDWAVVNKPLIRTMPMPLKAVEITFVHFDLRIKGIREGRWLTLYAYKGYQKVCKVVFEIDSKGMLIKRKGETILERKSFESVLTCYCALMAYMVYEKPELVKAEPQQIQQKQPTKKQNKVSNKDGVTYILKRRVIRPALGGHHASPRGIFTVRGHYRRYKSGKVVWIQEYKKGEGKAKSKTYKMENLEEE